MRAPDQRSDAACIHVAQMEDMAMRNFDLTPLWRSTVGFDRLFDRIEEVPQLTGEDNYPPYNIERTSEDAYRISLALAGFMPEEITVTAEQNLLTVEGRKAEKEDHQYLYQGISARPFRRQFNLAEVREVPEAMKPRQIQIASGTAGNGNQQTEHKKAA